MHSIIAVTRHIESDLTLRFAVEIIAQIRVIKNEVPYIKSLTGYFTVSK